MDASLLSKSRQLAACATDYIFGATGNENAAEANLGGVRNFHSEEEAYFFLPAGFLAFALEADLATLAAFFFAAIVSTSPNYWVINSSASIL